MLSDSGYTPSTESVRIAFGYVGESTPEIYEARVEAFARWLSAHDAVIREDQAERDIAIVNQLYPLGSEVPGNAPTVIAVALRSQSFTGTEK